MGDFFLLYLCWLMVTGLTFCQVLVRMDSNSKQIDEKLIVKPAPSVTFCQRKKSGNGSFVSKLRNHFHEFIHASVDEHKTCLRNTIQKVYFLLWMYVYIYEALCLCDAHKWPIVFCLKQIFKASTNFGKNSENAYENENSVQLHSSTRN